MSFDWKFFFGTFLKALGGIPVTLEITLFALAVAIPLGFLIAVANINSVRFLSPVLKVYISFIRGTPMIVQIYLIYNTLPSFLSCSFKSLGIAYDVFSMNNIVYAFVIFSFYETAMLAEVFRSAIGTVPKGQLEAAHTVGLTTAQAYARIIVPQALGSAIPVMCSAIVDLIKVTSLAFTMSVLDITAIAKTAAGMKLCWIEGYLDIFLIYLILIISLERAFVLAERKILAYKAA